MKYVQVRRHAPKYSHGGLTEEGRKLAQNVRKRLPKFHLVISSDKPRAIETALLLTGQQPEIDKRAGIPAFSLEQEKELHELGESHKYGIAGVIFEHPTYVTMIKNQGRKLTELIKDTLRRLSDNEFALIISHDGVMVSAQKILRDEPFDSAGKSITPLEGFQVNENLEVVDIK